MKIIHKNLSRTAILLAIINISLGVFLAVFEWYWILIWFIYLGLFICIYMMFEARRQSKNKSKSSEDDNLNDKSNNNSMISTSKNDLTKSNMSLNKLDDYDDGYEMNISKTDSTQQLRPSTIINDNPNPSNRTVENIKMDPIRYTPSSQLMAKSNTNTTTTKHSPVTPPPPYFNRNKNSISTIELDSYTIKTSSPNQSISRKTPSQAHLLSYSQQTNLNDLNDDIDNELPIEQNHQQHTSFGNLSKNNNNNNVNRPVVTPTPRKIYQIMNSNTNNINNNNNFNMNTNNNNPTSFYTVAQHTKTTLLNDNTLNSSFRMNSQHLPINHLHHQQHQQSYHSKENPTPDSLPKFFLQFLQTLGIVHVLLR